MLSLLCQFVREYVVSYVYVFAHAQLAVGHVDVLHIIKKNCSSESDTTQTFVS